MRSDDPDHDIVKLVEAGDTTAALRLVMKRHGAGVYQYCRQGLQDQTLADDVLQTLFIQLHRDLPRFAGHSKFRTWLFAIARNRVLDAAKARRRAQAHLEDDENADAPDPTADPADRIDDAHLAQALIECVKDLDESMRTPVVLRYQQGFTFEELAEICNEKPGTLQARVTRALRMLRKCIEARTGGKV